MPDRGHISLNGNPYRIDLQSYKVRDIVDFSPRPTTPGGSIVHSELGLYQPLLLTDWRHGFGFQWYSDAMGYMRTDGQLDTRHPGVVMMMTSPTSTDTELATKEGFCNFDGRLYSWGSTGSSGSGVRRYSASTWDDIFSDTAGTIRFGIVNYLLPTSAYLFAAVDGARIMKLDTADDPTNAGAGANSTDYRWLIIHNGNIYAGKDASNIVYYDSNTALTGLQGDPADDTNEIVVGQGGYPTLGAVSLFGKLYVFRWDGMWEIGEDNVARRVLDFSNEASSTNFRSWAIFNGSLAFPIRDKIFSWNGARVTDITPPPLSDTFPYVTYGRFDNLVAVGGFLYLTARTNESTYEEHILAFDGVGWHKLAEPLATGAGSITSMGYDVTNNRLWYHTSDTEETTSYITFQNLSDYPFADFPITGTHSWISSRIDMGFRRVTKSTPSLLVGASNILKDGGASERYLQVYYSLDGGAWTAWGGVDGTSNVISANGVTELTNPTGGSLSTIEYNYVMLRVDFFTEAATQTPVLEDLTLRFLMRPAVAYGYSFAIIASKFAEFNKHRDDREPWDVISALRTARDSKSPIAFTDPFDNTSQVYISSIQEQAVELHPDERGATVNLESRVLVNLVQVSS